MQELKIKLLNDNAKIPTRGSEKAAGWDLYAAIEAPITIKAFETEKISTGIAVALPEDTFGGIYARSGLATKKGLRPANCTGVIDEDYRGEVIVALHNDTRNDWVIEPGERIAQLVVEPYVRVKIIETSELDDTARGEGGFGSTGTK